MSKLKQLDVQGFKSFADSITFVYPTGITAIVGPNGSGKSNVADAIRWVLGEQRLTTIRGRTGEDMVFAGSKKRARSGMARASLTFDNSDGWLPVDFAEVIIERRTYRDGKTDYLLNNSRVRLMDLRDLLDRAGLGRDAYLIIGQGLVDHVLALRPQERLALFEQAAGIAPYRTRREDAVSRLEETRRNLERVYDIVGETEPHLRRLKKQAARAEQHAELTAELNATLRTWYGFRWGRAVAELEQARQRVVYRVEKVEQSTTESDATTTAIIALRQQMAEARAQLAELHRESSALHTEAERRQRELAVARERRRQLQERQEESQANLVPLRSALDAETQDMTTLQQEFEAAQAQLAEAQAQLAEAEVARREVEQQRQGLLSRQAQTQARALESRHRLADRQSRWEQATERLAQLAQRVAQLEADLASATERRRAQQTVVERARRALEEADAALQAAEADVARLEAALSTARSESENLRRDVGRKQAELQQVAARFEALERLHNEGAGLYAGVRATLQAVERGELRGLPGTIASLVRVPAHLDRAIETALGGQLQDIVAERWDDAQTAIEWLKRQRAGRATFLPLDTLDPPSVLDAPAEAGVVGVASELVDYAARYRPAVVLLLGRTAIAQSLNAARDLYRKLRDESRSRGSFRIVTLEGEIVRSGGAVTGGEERQSQSQGGSLLARARERRELPERISVLESEIKTLQDGLRERELHVQALQKALQVAGERRRAATQRRQEADRAVDREVRALDKLIQESDWQRNLLNEVGQERERLQMMCTRLEGERAETETALRDAEAQLAALLRDLTALADDETAHVAAERRTQMALLEQEHGNRRVLLATRQREVRRLHEQIAALEGHGQTLVEELSTLEERLGTLQGAYDEARTAADGLSTRIPPLETQLARLEQTLETHEGREREARRVLHDAEQRRAQAEVEANRREDQLQTLRREIEEALGIVVGDLPETLSAQQPLPLDAIVSPLPIVTELPEGLDRQIRDLRTQIRRLEPVNLAAKEEYDELEQRHTFLREQMTDLENASTHLRQIITELDEMMDTTFRTTFKAIASEFSRIFELLFNGGTAKLSMTSDEAEGDDLNGNDGVEIIARPPGKRTSGLGMLSGGERTLTAVALLFAVMRVSPTPFCILDEVDAMLDEANVGRFRAMLRELSRQTQFIIITHNRGTVEVSDTIYGVSMGDDGVSQVLSLSLEDLPSSDEG